MGKHIVVALFILMVGWAVSLLLNREQSPSRLVKSSERTSHIQLEEFVVYEYEGRKALSVFSGKFAAFIEPNMLEILGSIQGQRLDSPRHEFVAAESATMTFAAKGLTELMKNSQVQRSEIENQVRFGFDDNVLYTDYAQYLHDKKLLVSDVPVRVKGPQVDVQGSKGFEYQSETRDLKIFGPLEGTLIGKDH